MTLVSLISYIDRNTAMGGLPLGFVPYGASLYLNQALGCTRPEIGWALWVPPLGWEVGYVFWGWTIDRFAAHGDSLAGMRRLQVLLLLGLPLGTMCLAMFVAGGQSMAAMAYATRIYSSRSYGFLAGLGAGAWSLGWRWRCRYSAACSTTIATGRRSCWRRRFRWRGRWPGRR
jgi:hypothetical protein